MAHDDQVFKGEPQTNLRPVHTYREVWPCPHPNCNGEMVSNGEAFLTNPPQYHHACTKCDCVSAVPDGIQYPRIIYEETDD